MTADHDDCSIDADDNACIECGEPNDNGEGFDGRCGNCADRACDEEGEELVLADASATDEDVLVGVTFASFLLESEGVYRGVIFDGHEIRATTPETHATSDEAIAAARMLIASDDTDFLDADLTVADEEDPRSSYKAIFYDEENRFRGAWLLDGEVHHTTQLLYRTPAAARHAAKADLKDAA